MPKNIDQDALSDHLEGVRRLVRTLVRDECEVDDVVQDTMVAALENRTRVRSGLRAWLSGVARNMARRTARSEGRRSHHEGEALRHGTMPATADVIARAAEQRRVLDAVLGLAEPYRSAVLLRFIEDLPPRRIAKRLDLPVETVRTHVKRGLQRLRDQLEQSHGGHDGEARAALRLAATEPLGAAHARAMALARASGLLLLVAVGAGLWMWNSDRGNGQGTDSGPAAVSFTETDPSAPAPATESDMASQPRVPGSPPSQPRDGDPPIRVADAPGAAVVPKAPVVAAAPTQSPQTPPLPVQPLPDPEPKPEPRAAIEENEPKGKPGGGVEKGASEPAADAEGGEGGEFYEDDTSFSADEADKAIDGGLAWLVKRQRRDGSWGAIAFNATYGGSQSASEGMQAGPTALALYTLLKCKVPLDHGSVKRGFRYLEKNHYKPPSSYETSMLLLAITARADSAKMLSTSRNKVARRKLSGRYAVWATRLRDRLLRKREARGWRYNVKKGEAVPGGPEDLSSTQLAALALFSAHRLGIRVGRDVWEDILAFSMAQQDADGPTVVYRDPVDPTDERKARARGFAYMKSSGNTHEAEARGGMTACGIANLEMARFVLTDGGRRREAWDKRKDAGAVQDAIFDGLAWLDKNWSPFEDPHAKKANVYHVYWLYALERAMDLLGLKLVGRHRWYSEMGQELLNRQQDGHWDTMGRAGGHDVLDTCFALLFLKRATADQIPNTSVTGGTDGPADHR